MLYVDGLSTGWIRGLYVVGPGDTAYRAVPIPAGTSGVMCAKWDYVWLRVSSTSWTMRQLAVSTGALGPEVSPPDPPIIPSEYSGQFDIDSLGTLYESIHGSTDLSGDTWVGAILACRGSGAVSWTVPSTESRDYGQWFPGLSPNYSGYGVVGYQLYNYRHCSAPVNGICDIYTYVGAHADGTSAIQLPPTSGHTILRLGDSATWRWGAIRDTMFTYNWGLASMWTFPHRDGGYPAGSRYAPLADKTGRLYVPFVDGAGWRRLYGFREGLSESTFVRYPSTTTPWVWADGAIGLMHADRSLTMIPADYDGDGLPNMWEGALGGVPIEHGGVYKLDGSSSAHKDLYVEVDAAAAFAPLPGVLDSVVAAFARAPVSNPDSLPGIRLHVRGTDASGAGCEPCVDQTGLSDTGWGFQTQPLPGLWMLPSEYYALRTRYFGTLAEQANAGRVQAKAEAYRYCIFGRSFLSKRRGQAPSDGASGISELPGNDFAVTLGGGGWQPTSADEQAGTFMHELGHSLGLQHGGDNGTNYKPNYVSVMNYTWQTPRRLGTVPSPTRQRWNASRRLDYSREAFGTLVERGLSEGLGIGTSAYRGRFTPVGPKEGETWAQMVELWGPVNWDGVLPANGTGVWADVNYLPVLNGQQPSPGDTHHGWDDWSSIDYLPRTGAGWAYGAPVRPSPTATISGTNGSRALDEPEETPDEFMWEDQERLDQAEFDCNRNGIADDVDVASGMAADANMNGIPDECEFATVDVGGGPGGAVGSLGLRISRNPARLGETLRIVFAMPWTGEASVAVYDAAGRRVAVLAKGHHSRGVHRVEWGGKTESGRKVAAGVYFVRLSGLGASVSSRVVLLP